MQVILQKNRIPIICLIWQRQLKRFGAKLGHGIDGSHVHQPIRNMALNGIVFGEVGTKTKNGGVDWPKAKDVKQLYMYLNNNKYCE